jgi:nucleoside-diphosphate-sugar epimerase
MRTFVTGGDGFIGTALRTAMASDGHETFSYDIATRDIYDVRDYDSLSHCIANFRPDSIVHLAALPGVLQCDQDMGTAFDTNVTGTNNVLKVAEEIDTKVIFASSGAASNPTSYYGATKAAAEAFAMATHTIGACDVRILRFANVYGYGSHDKSSFVAAACRALWDETPIYIKGGRQLRDFVDVRDVVENIQWHLREPAKLRGSGGGRVAKYYVGTGKFNSVEDVATRLVREFSLLTGRPGKLLWVATDDTGGSVHEMPTDTCNDEHVEYRGLGEGLTHMIQRLHDDDGPSKPSPRIHDLVGE